MPQPILFLAKGPDRSGWLTYCWVGDAQTLCLICLCMTHFGSYPPLDKFLTICKGSINAYGICRNKKGKTDMTNILTFNTGRKYSKSGQRIAATIHDGKVYFVDHDRGIEGVLRHAVPLMSSAIMDAYDHNRYDMAYLPEVFQPLRNAIV